MMNARESANAPMANASAMTAKAVVCLVQAGENMIVSLIVKNHWGIT
jgi:hypothetical protein